MLILVEQKSKMKGISSGFLADNSLLSSSPSDGASNQRQVPAILPGRFPAFPLNRDGESDTSFSSIEAPQSPLEIDRIHVMPFTTEMGNSSEYGLSIKTATANQASPPWSNVPVMDVTKHHLTTLPSCLYSKRENAEQVSF